MSSPEGPPAARDFQVVFDCADPDGMARFWADALDYLVDPPPGGGGDWMQYQVDRGFPAHERVEFAAIRDPRGPGRLCFMAVPEGKVGKNRLHLDIRASVRDAGADDAKRRIDALVDRLRNSGAAVLRVGRERAHYFVVMTDVEGNEFCVH